MTTLDIDRFIIEIEDRPAIWDVRCNDYSNNIAKAKAWEMCDIFVPGFREMDSAGKKPKQVCFFIIVTIKSMCDSATFMH